MANNTQAFPAIDVVCKDRTRSFCLNLGAFRALEELMQKKTGNPDYNIYEDYSWLNDSSLENTINILWAGFFTDARKFDDKKEPWTIEKCEDVVSILSLRDMEGCIMESLQRVLSPAQLKKLEAEKEKKRKKTQKRK